MPPNRFWQALPLAAGLLASPASAQIEIQLWHAMGGALGEKVADIAAGFNASQSDFVVTAEHKGTYTEILTEAIEAFSNGEPPHIVHVFDVGTATMLAAEGFAYPMHELFADAEEQFDPSIYIPAIASYYGDADGNLLAMPFNSSTPVLFYNREAVVSAGFEELPPAWPDLADVLGVVQEAGIPCGFTTAWQSWIQIENFSAWHDVPLATQDNGFAGLDAELTINGEAQVAHIEALAEWTGTDLFRFGGRRGDARSLFLTGECAAFFGSSAAYAAINANAGFEFGIVPLPHWPEIATEPQNSVVGGAALWALRGREEADYAGVAKFMSYLSSPGVQADWHQYTGYLPVTGAAYELTREQGFYDANPGTEVGILQLVGNNPTANSRGPRLGGFVAIRDIVNEELEAVWAGNKSARNALNDATARGNEILRTFESESGTNDE